MRSQYKITREDEPRRGQEYGADKEEWYAWHRERMATRKPAVGGWRKRKQKANQEAS